MTWVLLAGAIAAEVMGTISLRFSAGFSKPVPSVLVVVGYAGAFVLLSMVLQRGLALGIAYAVWAAAGVSLVALFGAVFLGEQRDPYGPISVVGVSVIGGQVLAEQAPVAQEIATMLQLLAAVNLSLFLLNLLPILPLDGGHVLPAVWEAVKKRIARLRGRPDPGPVDLARLMPIGVGFAVLIMGYGLLVIVADIVNPIRLPL